MAKKHPLRAYRDAEGMSADELARKLKVSEISIRSYENGARQPSALRAIDFEKRIGIPREELRPDLFRKAA